MRHRKDTFKIGRTGQHNRCMLANLLKSLILQERIFTTTAKAKELRRHADGMISLAKKNTLDSRRVAIAKLMVRFNALTCKERKLAKEGNHQAYNGDRLVVDKLFKELGIRFANRAGGYTRVIKAGQRVGDNAEISMIEFLQD